jgi:uncharacterized protein (TIGR02145 family)
MKYLVNGLLLFFYFTSQSQTLQKTVIFPSDNPLYQLKGVVYYPPNYVFSDVKSYSNWDSIYVEGLSKINPNYKKSMGNEYARDMSIAGAESDAKANALWLDDFLKKSPLAKDTTILESYSHTITGEVKAKSLGYFELGESCVISKIIVLSKQLVLVEEQNNETNKSSEEIKIGEVIIPAETSAQIEKVVSFIAITKNLNVEKFRNGDLIPEANTNEKWANALKNSEPAWCWFKNDSGSEARFGKLYNIYAIVDSRGLAPEGWHIPSAEEWDEVFKKINDVKNEDKRNYKKILKSLRGCGRDFTGQFPDYTSKAVWWSSSADAEDYDLIISACIDKKTNTYTLEKSNVGNGYSVRCLKD